MLRLILVGASQNKTVLGSAPPTTGFKFVVFSTEEGNTGYLRANQRAHYSTICDSVDSNLQKCQFLKGRKLDKISDQKL